MMLVAGSGSAASPHRCGGGGPRVAAALRLRFLCARRFLPVVLVPVAYIQRKGEPLEASKLITVYRFSSIPILQSLALISLIPMKLAKS